jgi:hypothetical protein
MRTDTDLFVRHADAAEALIAVEEDQLLVIIEATPARNMGIR